MNKRKLPKAAIPDIVVCAETEGKYTKKPAREILRRYFQLMDRYSDYFFDSPWPKEFNIDNATTFTDNDYAFMVKSTEEDYLERLETMCIKKNLYQGGFMEFGKFWWTSDAFKKELDKIPDEEAPEAQKTAK